MMKTLSTTVTAAPLALAALLLGATTTPVLGGDGAVPFDVGELFFQLNDTDGDLGIHALVDGDPWERLVIKDSADRTVLRVRLRGRLRRQGLTEFKFESAEPPFKELAPDEFFARFPAGEYTIEGVTLDGEERENPVTITHVLPAPPDDLTVTGEAAPEDCDEGPVPVVSEPLVISWSAVTESHPDLGEAGPVDIIKYEVDVDREEPTALGLNFSFAGDMTELTIPAGLFGSGDFVRFQVLAADAAGNETSSESCFELSRQA